MNLIFPGQLNDRLQPLAMSSKDHPGFEIGADSLTFTLGIWEDLSHFSRG